MTASEPTPSTSRAPRSVDPEVPASSDGPVTTLRGAGVDVDPRRAAQLVVGTCLVALAVVAVILLVSGIRKNAHDASLQDHGVPVSVTVSGCLGLLGGSGSNAAGYACKGTYTFDGRHYQQAIPGNALLPAGSVVRGVIVPGDPRLLSTPATVATQQPSSKVYIVPAILFGILVVAVVVMVLARRHRRAVATPTGRRSDAGGVGIGSDP